MDNKLSCQLITILLDKDNHFSNKYTSIVSCNIDYQTLLNDYFIGKDMRTIKIDNDTQSICFTNQNGLININNSATRKTESYYEEVHIHCNDLKMFESFVDYLKKSEYSNNVDDTSGIPHYESINIENLKDCELVMEPMTNQVATTKSLLNILSKNNDETIFRAIAIHFGQLVNKTSDIDFELVHELNNIYQKNVEGSDYGFFSEDISNKLLNIYEDENSYQSKIGSLPSYNTKFIDDTEYDYENVEKGI